ncbi:hypothetical protein R1flu_028173 [Riccia fluitans]|uniref:Uncharacterized protein n=1 Tax=Riccia fluitans TaxID=41844 RepID=A0ABD1XL04_9MARC
MWALRRTEKCVHVTDGNNEVGLGKARYLKANRRRALPLIATESSPTFGKSPDGGMKKKDLSKAVLSVALKAAEASSVSLDKIVLKEELMRQEQPQVRFGRQAPYVSLGSEIREAVQDPFEERKRMGSR